MNFGEFFFHDVGLIALVRIAIVLGILIAIGYAYHKTLWDWMKLLIVPAVLATGGYLFAGAENRTTQRIADQCAQDEALQAYLGEMGPLMLDNGLGRSQERGPVSPREDNQVAVLVKTLKLKEGCR